MPDRTDPKTPGQWVRHIVIAIIALFLVYLIIALFLVYLMLRAYVL